MSPLHEEGIHMGRRSRKLTRLKVMTFLKDSAPSLCQRANHLYT